MKARYKAVAVTNIACVLAGALFAFVAQSYAQKTDNAGVPIISVAAATPLTDDAIVELALQYTAGYFPTEEKAMVVLTRPVKLSELSALGLGSIDFLTDSAPLVVVVVKGDFDTRSMDTQNLLPPDRKRSTFIAYIYDRGFIIPIKVMPSPNGGALRKLLNDPHLPPDPTWGPIPLSSTTVAIPMPTLPIVTPAYNGGVAPPIVVPPETSDGSGQ